MDTAKDGFLNDTFPSIQLERLEYKLNNESRNHVVDTGQFYNDTYQDEMTEIEKAEISQTMYNCQLYRFMMSIGVTGSLCLFGIVGNILTLLVFRKFSKDSSDKRIRSSAALLLSALAISDFALLFFSIHSEKHSFFYFLY